MASLLKPDLCVIGAGSGGLSVAAAAAQLGVSVVLIEKAEMGGDCLNTGCVPSKAMLAAGKHAELMRHPEAFGIKGVTPEIDGQAVHDHIHSVIAAIAPNDSVERFTGMGVHVIEAEGRFENERTVRAGDFQIKARRFVIATGSSPALPPIEGIEEVPHFTNETIFEKTELPAHLIIIGGGPIGMELAQAHRRLGSEVTVLEAFTALGKDDPELTALVLERLKAEGIAIHEGISIERLEKTETGVRAHLSRDGAAETLDGSHLLVAAGRKPNVDGLDLDAAKVDYDRRGIKVSANLKTSNSRVYAIGDVAGGLQFTHMANYHAGLVIRNALFRMPVKVNNDVIPWVTYTDPELAHVGLGEEAAKSEHGDIRVLRWPYAENDRAQAERATQGFVKVVTSKRGRILGVSIVGEHAGELIQVWSLAITKKMKIGDLTKMVVAYPTLAEINKRVAYTYYLPSLTNPNLRRIIKFMRVFG